MNTLTSEPHIEIKAAIAFYEKHGWDWMSVVAFLSAKAFGTWPPKPVPFRSIGRKRKTE